MGEASRLGYSKHELLQLSPTDLEDPNSVTSVAQGHSSESKSITFERTYLTRDNKKIPVEINAQLFQLDGETLMLSIARDLTERKKAEQALQQSKRELEQEKLKAENLARTDDLTGLYNRRAFFEAAAAIDQQSRRYRRPYSIIVLDLDHFKQINDRYGHAVGDQALVAVAATIGKVIRCADVAARVGGEEFFIILPETRIQECMSLAERLRTAIAEIQMQTNAEEVVLSGSFGVAEYEQASESLSVVLKHADHAMYQAKSAGRDRVVAYSDQ